MAEPVAESPFRFMKISSWEPLRKIMNRSQCPLCGKSRKFYCYSCYVLVNLKPSDIPNVILPVKIDIIKHPLEVDGKSTASHAKLLSPNFVEIYKFPDVPDYSNERVVLAYPNENSLTCDQLEKRFYEEFPDKKFGWNFCDKIIFIDSTWQQTHQILKHKNIENLQSVKLTEVKTCFWRHQRKSEFHLATIEAIYYLLRELELTVTQSYNRNYDDLLYFFSFQYDLIKEVAVS